MPELSFGEEVAEAQHDQRPADEAATLTVSADEFSALEERVLRAVNLVKRERLARAAAEERATQAESRLAEQTETAGNLSREIDSLRTERESVRQRVEKVLTQLDALEV
jgi:chromosome segregation ATPase